MRLMKNKILIIGAGPAGLVCGKKLLQLGHEVVILEKQKFPRLVVGESLLPVSMDHFEEVGFLEDLSKVKWAEKHGAQFKRGSSIFEVDFAKNFTQNSKTWTWQVQRDKFDQVIANNVINAGGTIEFGAQIDALDIKDKVECSFSIEGKEFNITADFLVDSSGFSGVSAKLMGHTSQREYLDHSSVFSHFNDPKSNQYEDGKRIKFYILERDLWAWIIPFHEDIASIGFVGNNKYFDTSLSTKEKLEKLFIRCEELTERIQIENSLFEPIIIQNYSQKSLDIYGDKYCLIGNCAEFLDPIFSSGVAFATGTGIKAAEQIDLEFKGKSNWESYQEYLDQGVQTFKTYVDSWYSGELQNIFFSDYPKMDDLEKQITSVLAGYVWDENNPFVKNAGKNLKKLNHFLERMQNN